MTQKYIGESGRKLGTRIEEQKKENDKVTNRRKTCSTSVLEDTSQFNSAISEHTRGNNHIINWDNTKILERESEKYRRLSERL